MQYISPVQGVQDELRKMGGEAAALADNQLMFPDASTLANLQSWGNLDEDEEQLFDEEFARITGRLSTTRWPTERTVDTDDDGDLRPRAGSPRTGC